MSHVWDPETEELRRELLVLPLKELMYLAEQEGVKIDSRRPSEIIEALLALAWVEVDPVTAPPQASEQLGQIKHRDQPGVTSKHASHSSSANHPAAGSHHHQQIGRSSAAPATRRTSATHSLTAAQAHSKVEEPQQQYGIQELRQKGSFTFAQPKPSNPSSSASNRTSNSSIWEASGTMRTADIGSQHTAFRDQVVEAPGPRTQASAPAGSSRPSSVPYPSTGFTKEMKMKLDSKMQQMKLESKMQQLESTLQKLTLSPRHVRAPTPPRATRSQTAKATAHENVAASSSSSYNSSSSYQQPRTQECRKQLSSTTGGAALSSSRPASSRGDAAAPGARRPVTTGGSNAAASSSSSRPCSAGAAGLSTPTSSRTALYSQQQQSAPSTPKGAVRVGIMPCQKAILKKALAASAAGRSPNTPKTGAGKPSAAGARPVTPLPAADSPSNSRHLSPRKRQPAMPWTPTAAACEPAAAAVAVAKRPKSTPHAGPAASAGAAAAAAAAKRPVSPYRPHPASAGQAASVAKRSVSPYTPVRQVGRPSSSPHTPTGAREVGAGPGGPRQVLDNPPTFAGISATSRQPQASRWHQQQQQQQQGQEWDSMPPGEAGHGQQLLHTPLRVPMQHSSSAANPAERSRVDSSKGRASSAAVAGPATVGMQDMYSSSSPSMNRVAAATPRRSQALAAAATAGDSMATPLCVRGMGHASAAAAAGNGGSGSQTPQMQVMGSARRVATTQSQVAPNPDPSSPAATVPVGLAGAGSSAAVPVTPLHRPARRLPSDGGISDEVDKHLQALVERCLNIRNPEAPRIVLHGPEPAKRWLQQHIVTPLRQAGSSSGSSSTTCLAAGFCHRSLLLYGPSGSGKTELVHALAAEMGASLLYVPAGENLLKTYQQEGHRLLRALFAVARRTGPSVVCFDDAHVTFPAKMSDPGCAVATSRMLVELQVQLQQLADMQHQLEATLQQKQQSRIAGDGGSSSSSSNTRRSRSTSGGGAATLAAPPTSSRPAWGFFSSKSKIKKQGEDAAAGSTMQQDLAEQQQQQQQQQLHTKLAGPLVVVFVTCYPEALDPRLLNLLPVHLLLHLPSLDSREELLMGWLMEREAAVGVHDVEKLARQTDGFSCNDLMQLCHHAAMRPMQERCQRAVCMADLEAVLRRLAPAVQQARQGQPRLQL